MDNSVIYIMRNILYCDSWEINACFNDNSRQKTPLASAYLADNAARQRMAPEQALHLIFSQVLGVLHE